MYGVHIKKPNNRQKTYFPPATFHIDVGIFTLVACFGQVNKFDWKIYLINVLHVLKFRNLVIYQTIGSLFQASIPCKLLTSFIETKALCTKKGELPLSMSLKSTQGRINK